MSWIQAGTSAVTRSGWWISGNELSHGYSLFFHSWIYDSGNVEHFILFINSSRMKNMELIEIRSALLLFVALAMGTPGATVWSEIWEALELKMTQVRNERRGQDNKALRFDLHRYVFLQVLL